MRINTAPRKKNKPRPAEKSAPAYLQWLRGRECALASHRAGGCGFADIPRNAPVEAAHVDYAGDKGMGTKCSDAFAIPLCQRHHDEQHGKIGSFRSRGGWPTFEMKYGINALSLAHQYWSRWPGRAKWERDNTDDE